MIISGRHAMRSDPLMRAVSRISEAALAPDRWPAALQSITEAVGALGVGYLLLKKRTGGVEWVSMAGLSVDVNDYINYYAARDPYRPVLEAAPNGSWGQLSKCLPQTVLRSDEWYNDYAVKAGIGDIIGTRLFDSPSCTIILSAHWGIYQAPVPERGAAIDDVTASNALARDGRVRLVLPFEGRSGLFQVEGEQNIRVRGDDIHRVVDDERGCLLPAVDTGRKGELDAQIGDVAAIDLIELRKPGRSIVLRRHRPLAVILRRSGGRRNGRLVRGNGRYERKRRGGQSRA